MSVCLKSIKTQPFQEFKGNSRISVMFLPVAFLTPFQGLGPGSQNETTTVAKADLILDPDKQIIPRCPARRCFASTRDPQSLAFIVLDSRTTSNPSSICVGSTSLGGVGHKRQMNVAGDRGNSKSQRHGGVSCFAYIEGFGVFVHQK